MKVQITTVLNHPSSLREEYNLTYGRVYDVLEEISGDYATNYKVVNDDGRKVWVSACFATTNL